MPQPVPVALRCACAWMMKLRTWTCKAPSRFPGWPSRSAQRSGRGEAVYAGQAGVEDRDVGPCLERGGLDLAAALQLSDDPYIGPQAAGPFRPPESVSEHRLAPALQNVPSGWPA
jgi:hypothetical protein